MASKIPEASTTDDFPTKQPSQVADVSESLQSPGRDKSHNVGRTGSSEPDIWIRPEAYERRQQRREQGDNEDDGIIDVLVCEFYVSTVAISGAF
ncbi:hypothetical protein KAF25_002541 [Fusarium avenaceum]|uniref:Uncharacterized protein n=1 Tax=Fusarium avenaceum TaxID=40199 RepID=A0A9P7KSH3_9HYPO|nr:hypothetical protein KAF25_002541 [Fusarium avenaceum]